MSEQSDRVPDGNHRKPAIGFWATVGGFVVVAYVLSFGPAVWMLDREVLPASSTAAVEIVYYPIVCGMSDGPRPIRRLVEWYAALGARPREARIFDGPSVERRR